MPLVCRVVSMRFSAADGAGSWYILRTFVHSTNCALSLSLSPPFVLCFLGYYFYYCRSFSAFSSSIFHSAIVGFRDTVSPHRVRLISNLFRSISRRRGQSSRRSAKSKTMLSLCGSKPRSFTFIILLVCSLVKVFGSIEEGEALKVSVLRTAFL